MKISPITQRNSEYYFSITSTDTITGETGTAEYRTTSNGTGLDVYAITSNNLNGESEKGWKQLLGTSQIDLTSGDRRAKVAFFALQGAPEFEDWCRSEAINPTPTSAKKYLQWINR